MDDEYGISELDRERLQTIIDQYLETGSADERRAAEVLRERLCKAVVLASHEIPDDAVTMNSIFRLSAANSKNSRVYALVYPSESNPTEGRMSVLDPVGAQLLGRRKGSTVECDLPHGKESFRIEDVIYQPESAGHFDL